MTRKPVITEREVRIAKREGRASLDVGGAVVTPSARDAAKRSGVELTGGAAAPSTTRRRTPLGSPPERQVRTGKPAPRHRPDAGTGMTPQAAPTTQPAAPSAAKPAPATAMRLAIGADHGGVAMKAAIASHLRDRGIRVDDLGTGTTDAVDYPDFAVAVAKAVGSGAADVGIMIDGAGIGSCMAANKVRGVRAAMCYDLTTATNAREHNDANVLTLGGGLIGARLALEIVDRFLATPFAGGRHAKRVDKIKALDR